MMEGVEMNHLHWLHSSILSLSTGFLLSLSRFYISFTVGGGNALSLNLGGIGVTNF